MKKIHLFLIVQVIAANFAFSQFTTECTGGVITHADGNTIHTFTGDGSLVCTETGNVSYLVVAGGGGGGNNYSGGGGGGGGFRTGSGYSVSGSVSVTVGGGGAAQTAGGNSVFGTVTSIGGGAGGSYQSAGGTGGSGGGGSGNAGSPTPGGSGSIGEGNNGADGALFFGSTCGGGGGGAGAVGQPGSGNRNGGAGSASGISGSSVTYAGGGGGGCESNANAAGTGGAGGGGSGSNTGPGSNGAVNSGGGGGGAGGPSNPISGGTGGSGIVIISYPTPGGGGGGGGATENIGIGGLPDPSAKLDIQSTTSGVAFPRMTASQRDDITDPVTGLVIYNTDENALNVFDGTDWQGLTGGVGPLGQSSTTVYGTGTLSVSSATTSWTLIPGLITTVTVPSNSLVYISADGGISNVSTGTGAANTDDIMVSIDGTGNVPSNGRRRRVSMVNNSNSGSAYASWSIGFTTTLSAGTHTIEVDALYAAGVTVTNVSSDNTAPRQGALTVTILKQ